MKQPEISVIIPTYNGQHKVINCLKSLDLQDLQDFEIIVVIDGSIDDTYREVKRAKFKKLNKGITVRVHTQKNQGRATVRNVGAKLAQGRIVLFLDDDMRLGQSNALSMHLKHHEKFPKSVLVGGQIEDLSKMTTDFQFYKAFLSRTWEQNIEEKYPQPLVEGVNFLTAAHFSISKELFMDVGGFRNGLTDAEDYELAHRLKIHEMPIYFNNKIIGWHDDFITCQKFILRQSNYIEAHKKLKTEFRITHTLLSNNDNQLKRLIYLFFSNSLWHKIVDRSNFLLILPKKTRYKIYDLIITAGIKSNI